MVIVGIDEVGRGCWAGPLVACAVILDHNFSISKDRPWRLGDSKKLSTKQRIIADKEIRKIALSIGIGWVMASEIDSIGLTKAVGLAMKRALDQITVNYDSIIIDGNYNHLPDDPKSSFLVRADDKVPAVSAASIVAKVARDKYMQKITDKYPEYQFEKHVGYGTKLHHEMLIRHGICDIHRKSYKPIMTLMAIS